MKILCTADWHLHNFSDFAKDLNVTWSDSELRYIKSQSNDSQLMNSRLFEILNALCYMRDYCLKNSISDVLMAGDVFHKRAIIDVTVFNSTYRILKSFKDSNINVHIISGNHDDVDSSLTPTTSLNTFYDIAHVIEDKEVFTIGDIEVVAVAYSKSKKKILNTIATLRDECKQPNNAILLAHLGLTGAVTGSSNYTMKDEYNLTDLKPNLWSYIVLGHYHKPQLIKNTNNTFYCGTPIQNNFNDEILDTEGDYNGFYVINTEIKELNFQKIIAPRFVTLNSLEDLKKHDKEFFSNNYIRIKSNSENEKKFKDILDNNLKVKNEVRFELKKDYNKELRSDITISNSISDSLNIYIDEQYTGDNKEQLKELALSILEEATIGKVV